MYFSAILWCIYQVVSGSSFFGGLDPDTLKWRPGPQLWARLIWIIWFLYQGKFNYHFGFTFVDLCLSALVRSDGPDIRPLRKFGYRISVKLRCHARYKTLFFNLFHSCTLIAWWYINLLLIRRCFLLCDTAAPK